MSEGEKRVFHILPAVVFGGFETLCLQMIRFSPPGYKHFVVNTEPCRNDAVPLFEASGCTVLPLLYTGRDRAGSVTRMARLMNQHRPDGVLIYRFGDQGWVLEAGRRAKVSGYSIHVGTHPVKTHYEWIQKIVESPNVAHIPLIFCSKGVEAHYRAMSKPCPGSRTVYNGIDVEGVHTAARAARDIRKVECEGPVIGMTARIVNSKNHPLLLAAYRRARQMGLPPGELWLIGNGELEEDMKRKVTAWGDGMANEVKFLGARNDVPSLLGQLDIFAFSVLPIEGCGNALMEAMAAELPIVATDVPACREMMGDAGILVPPSSEGQTFNEAIVDLAPAAESMAEAFLYLWKNPLRCVELGVAAYKRAQEEFQASRAVREYLDAMGL